MLFLKKQIRIYCISLSTKFFWDSHIQKTAYKLLFRGFIFPYESIQFAVLFEGIDCLVNSSD